MPRSYESEFREILTEELLLNCQERGLSVAKTASMTNCTEQQVRRMCKEFGIVMTRPKKDEGALDDWYHIKGISEDNLKLVRGKWK